VSFRAESKLSEGLIEVQIAPPPLPVKKMFVRAPLPDGWKVESVQIDGIRARLMDGDTVDFSGRTEPAVVKFAVKR
jgi:hypothetical protein